MHLHLSTRLRALACALGTMLAAGAAHGASTQLVTISASVAKPLTLSWAKNLDLGSIALGPGTWSSATVGISRAGTFSCANINLICTGAVSVAQYQVTGSNNMTVRISAPNVTLVNQSDPASILVLVIDKPATITLPNSGVPGTLFSLGGSITLSSATVAGLYSGTFNVTVDY